MIYVFKTSVSTKKAVQMLTPQLDKIMPTSSWNFDLEDCDKVLRIDSEENIEQEVRLLLEQNDFVCIELE